MPRGQRPYSRLSRPEALLFLPSSSSVILTRLSGPRSRPTTFFFLVIPGASGSVARNSDHYTTEAVLVTQRLDKIIHINIVITHLSSLLIVPIDGANSTTKEATVSTLRYAHCLCDLVLCLNTPTQ
jgi:hypothetical protein